MILNGKRILVVEDEYLIAADLKRSLTEEGADVVGPVGDVGKGLTLVGRGGLDAAVLDINLAGRESYPIADALAASGTPFLFLTGYDSWSLPDEYSERPMLPMPYSNAAVVGAVLALCRRGAAA